MANNQTWIEREFFRIDYPIPDQPFGTLNGRNGLIHNLSEQGLKWLPDDGRVHISRGMTAFGAITFKDGFKFIFKGNVVRIADDTVAIHLSAPIPLGRIMIEQRILIQKYGSLK